MGRIIWLTMLFVTPTSSKRCTKIQGSLTYTTTCCLRMTSSSNRKCVLITCLTAARGIHESCIVAQGYIAHVFSGLGMIGMNTTSYQLHGMAKRMAHRAPSMWKHLWIHRRSLLNNPALSSAPVNLTTLPPETVITYPADWSGQFDPGSVAQQLQSGSSDRLVLILLMYGWTGLYKMRSAILSLLYDDVAD